MTFKRIKILAPFFYASFELFLHILRILPSIESGAFKGALRTIAITYPLDLTVFLVFYFCFSTDYLKKTKLPRTIVLSILAILFFGFSWVILYDWTGRIKMAEDIKLIFAGSLGHVLLNAFYGTIFRIAIEWFEKQQQKRELEAQNVRTELSLLRARINPHFLFNVLNNINSFAQKKSDKTSYAIIKLSEIMRYMLYDVKDEQILLDKEIAYIQNYLELQKLRYQNVEFVRFNITGGTSHVMVPPLLFMPFIENAFKHGRKQVKDSIRIVFEVQNNFINFTCTNFKRILNSTEEIYSSGLGLPNIKRRLDLLFGNNYQLNIHEDENEYFVALKIQAL